MIKPRMFLAASLLIPALYLAPALRADTTPAAEAAPIGGIAPKALFDPTDKSSASRFTAANGSETQVSVAAASTGTGVDVTIQPGEAGYPGVALKPEGPTPWDLSPYGNIQATITNTGAKKAGVSIRVDNDGDWHESPWSTENFYFNPGETKTVKVIFGYSFGGKPSYALKSNAITEVLFFSGKVSGTPLTFHIDSVEASGSAGEKPPVDPSTVRVVPPNGFIVGPGVTIDAAKQLIGKGGATSSVVDSSSGPSLKLNFPPGKGEESVTLKPAAGKWDLREALEIRVKVRNDGQAPVTPSALSASSGGPTETIAASAPLAPGAEIEIVIPFINPKIWKNTPPALSADPGTGNKYTNNAGTSVTVSVPGADAAQTLTVESIQADQPSYSAPDWLGTRPPEEGEWTKTFDDEFDGTAIDEKKWNTMADNFWDKRTHFSKDETTVGNGMATLRYEKKTGYQADDPTKKQTDYAAGYLDTYGKWVQRYGYFEARIKLPKAPGLWPAFWLMPDRGAAFGPQWKRANTGIDKTDNSKGMEFDICEYLSGWGPFRYNIAMHWDGYGKDHKATGQTTNYVQPDKDGFITPALLWLPGKAIYYCNGKEILHYENDRVSDTPSNIIFNYVSGGWDNLPLEDAKLPSDLVIDYVRCWQRKDLASDADGVRTPAPATPPAAK
jgi:beta-glucanase (GH16 family)